MRKTYQQQSTIFDIMPDHSLGREYQAISRLLDQHPRILEWVASDLGHDRIKSTGRLGLTAETILRAALVKQHHQFSYDELEILVVDSNTFSAFCRLNGAQPSRSALQAGISRITHDTWERINRAVLTSASVARVEVGSVVRIDSTPIPSDIHHPMDSTLLWDAVRVLTRLMRKARKLMPELVFCDRSRATKRRLLQLRFNSRKADKKKLYRDLLGYTEETLGYVKEAMRRIPSQAREWKAWLEQAKHFSSLTEKVVSQTRRRVFRNEKVPASEKVVSLFEPHTDIIVKGSRDVTYGHKVNLTTGRSGMVLDLVVEAGNPTDSERAVPMIERLVEIYGSAPRQCAMDGAYACKKNIKAIKAMGVKDAVFQKKRGLKIKEMAKSQWVYRKLRNFRAGVESIISCLKRSFGWKRCTWKGLARYKAYVWSSAVAFNLVTLGRKLCEQQLTI